MWDNKPTARVIIGFVIEFAFLVPMVWIALSILGR